MQSRADEIRAETAADKRIVFVSGNFNILHPGHLRLLKFAADMADVLVVGLRPDGTPGVTVRGEMRLESVRSLNIVDHALILTESTTTFIERLRPDFVVKGKEFEEEANPEADAVASYGGKLIFSSGEMRFASMDLLNRDTATDFSTITKPHAFADRHSFDISALGDILHSVSGMRVAVIGDLIVDDYITCDALGMSQEDPTIVVTPIQTKTFVGGAGVVAAHARNLGAETTLFTVIGGDDASDLASAELGEAGIDFHGFLDETRPTTRKQRFRALNKTLLRVNHLRQHDIGREIETEILKRIEALLPKVDLLMFADFNYGCLPQTLVDAIGEMARARGVIMTADSQASSQVSDISRFKGMSLITPTEREARLAMRDSASGLAVLAEELRETADAANVIITLGGEGMLVHGKGESGKHMTDRLPALNTSPKDVAGAGDSLFTATSMALCGGYDIWRGAYLGAVAAACQVSRVGNSPLRCADILKEIELPDE
ncbi:MULTISPECIES: PfkB family carbohydrate kinase [Aurantimonas]|uniref:PfkB family carbohydrate kinase n=1 Tax=Aurantimonas TaxID=182269 RepID=UPI0029B4AE70|nr:PfkB family carbohydrate kinase [Aurantimonas coralicida]